MSSEQITLFTKYLKAVNKYHKACVCRWSNTNIDRFGDEVDTLLNSIVKKGWGNDLREWLKTSRYYSYDRH